MKYVIIIGDGMADNKVEELGLKTPLECANKPFIDALAQKGELGTVCTVPNGVEPGSDTAILSIFGYNPLEYYSGRSPFEAAGSGIKLENGDVSYRCNMVSLEDDEEKNYKEKKVISHNGGSVNGNTAIELMEYLLSNTEFKECAEKNSIEFFLSPSFRHIAVQKNSDTEGLVTLPPHDHLGEQAGNLQAYGNKNAEALNMLMEISNKVLEKHPINKKRKQEGKLPVNGIWFWAQGKAITLPNFKEKYNKDGFVVTAVPLVKGIAALAGMSYVNVDGATGELDTNYSGKTQAVLDGLTNDKNFAVLHVEAPDECTHNGDLNGKLKAIENIDKYCVEPLVKGLANAGEDFKMLILSDHKTLSSTRGHDGEPVPYILYNSKNINKNSVVNGYDEKNAEHGIFIEDGYTLIEKLFQD